MPYKKGQSGNPKGKPKGATNRTSEEVRLALLKLFDDNLNKLQKDIDSMQPKDRAYLLVNLAKHVVAAAVNPDQLTNQQLEQIVAYLQKQQNEANIKR